MKFVYIWQFDVVEGREPEFENVYGPEGAWVKLFQHDGAYLNTTLIRDIHTKGRFLTIDVWKDRNSYISFREMFKRDFEKLDKQCESLTTKEIKIGEYAVPE